ncbi:TadE/TadG family type IV pilus assembly protein [Paenibacillus sp. IHBB 10380]|uniref:TadE/TadG family type IV pilus assembly protein n=1 Tax=Paenibacillus sp. IHBB 10380 TaxID=1566358 RepID=UPI0005CFB2D2|nr:hypothetical protein [Paenibacillus sp. IHBB 10380]AJS59830.1 hypothetical protein UB51_16595 [Paenibacillus sp. IHBB 10380]
MLRKWHSEQRGSVSIFLIMIFTIVFVFVAIFIDYARIAAMKVQSERLIRSGVRSVMSAYDQKLQQNYGLYAFGESNGDQIMATVLNGGMEHGDRSDAFSVLPLKLDTSTLQMDRMLGQYDIFNRQISEEMKYKAPIDFTLELLNKFKPLSKSMKEASNTVDVLRKLQKLYDKREEALDDMLVKQKKAAQSTKVLSELIMDSKGSSFISDEALGNSGIRAGNHVAAQYQDYVTQSLIIAAVNKDGDEENDDDDSDTDDDNIVEKIEEYQRGVSNLLSQISNKQNSARDNHAKMLPQSLELWEEAYGYNEQMKQVIAESESRSVNEGYDQVTRGNSPGSEEDVSKEDADTIGQIRQQTQKVLLSESLLQELKKEIEVQTSAYQSLDSQLMRFNSELGSATDIYGNSSQMKSTVIQISRQLETYLHNYFLSGSSNIIETQIKKLEMNRSSDKERKATEKKAKAKLKDAAKILNSIHELDDKAQAYLEEYRTVQQYYEESLAFNKGTQGDSYKGSDLDNDPYDAGKSAMNDMDDLYGSMGSIMSMLSDEFYQNEYAANYFHHFDVSRLGSIVSNPESSIGDDIVDQLSIHNQELEYILYGFHNPVGNVSAAYAEIFATRLAIRTMEGLVKNSKLGNPLLILAAALLYGIEMAIADMIELCQKGSVELSAYLRVRITYRDYLRLFLFIHSNNDKKMSRILSLIRFNTGINPAERATYASSEARIGMRLWFLPGVMKMVGFVSGSQDEVEGNRYYVTKKADFSY